MDKGKVLAELKFYATRSSGAGGQNVNKVASKVVLTFNLGQSVGLSSAEKALIKEKLANRLNGQQALVLHCDDNRSQHRNKEIVTARFLQLLAMALQVQKPRKATMIPSSAVQKRLLSKKIKAQIKSLRKRL